MVMSGTNRLVKLVFPGLSPLVIEDAAGEGSLVRSECGPGHLRGRWPARVAGS
ncbi:hypothetical protein Ga0074812_12588 [Parafrankia irregularis]|uniref:Uncharacterized protein n=1 Tax=Parafrankia irregularis TaxID=795642 RepID=A0A0S4QUJ8_9ACTN|nr:hypothetical protein Ga0074812_12588 [Parafrankia irregularis]